MARYSASTSQGAHYVTFPGFAIRTDTCSGADKLVSELNCLDGLTRRLGEDYKILVAQTVEKDRECERLDVLASKLDDQVHGLREDLTTQIESKIVYMDMVRRCRRALAHYLEPGSNISKKYCIGELLSILDNSKGIAAEAKLTHMAGNGVGIDVLGKASAAISESTLAVSTVSLQDAIDGVLFHIDQCEDIIALETLNEHLRKLLQMQFDKLF